MTFLFILILGASVSSGWAGLPAGERFAQWLNLPFANVARPCRALSREIIGLQVPPRTLVFNADASYWDSYEANCAPGIASVQALYTKVKRVNSKIIIATVPKRDAGGFYKWACSWIEHPRTSTQRCRIKLNQAIRSGCTGPNCYLIDSDAIYTKHTDIADIHLTPAIWREEMLALWRRLPWEFLYGR